jgi:hypothetical protein
MEPTRLSPIIALFSGRSRVRRLGAAGVPHRARRSAPSATVLPCRRARQSGGFFLHMGTGQEGRGSGGTALTRAGVLLIAAALIILAADLITHG